MNKKEALRIISECAKLYEELLLNKKILIVYGQNPKTEYIEVVFKEENFLHLTGIEKLTNINAKQFSNLYSSQNSH